jgi:hypothetical protein
MAATRRSERRDEGPASNGQQAQTGRATAIGAPVLRATTISFGGLDTILDSGNGLSIFPVGARVRVQGSSTNNREFLVVTSSAGTLTVRPRVVSSAASGPTIELRRIG